MKFRNATDDVLEVPGLGVSVEPGETTPDLDRKAAAGLVGQVDVWSAVGKEAKQEQKEVVQEITEEKD